MVDFHSHILPGIDDGSASLEESIELLKREAEQGINHVVATPHFYAQHDTPAGIGVVFQFFRHGGDFINIHISYLLEMRKLFLRPGEAESTLPAP